MITSETLRSLAQAVDQGQLTLAELDAQWSPIGAWLLEDPARWKVANPILSPAVDAAFRRNAQFKTHTLELDPKSGEGSWDTDNFDPPLGFAFWERLMAADPKGMMRGPIPARGDKGTPHNAVGLLMAHGLESNGRWIDSVKKGSPKANARAS